VDLHAGSIGFLGVALNSANILGYRNDQVYPEDEGRARSGWLLEMVKIRPKTGGHFCD
jgi:hypothetical protein